jgi:hypothetical protein
MRKRVFSILGVLIIAALTAQTAMAAARHVRKARAPAPVNHQVRDAFGSASNAVGSKSCDRLWCYEN